MKSHLRVALSARKKLLLVTAGCAALILSLAAGALTKPRLKAQTATDGKPKFDAASIKPTNASDQGSTFRHLPGGLFRANYMPPRALIASAYLNEFPPKGRLIFGGPAWIDSEHFDIEARAEGNPSNETQRLMLQSLLEDRFKLVLHHETRQLPLYTLVLAKPGKIGPQLTAHSGDAKCTDPTAGKPLPQPNPGEAMPAYCGGFFMNSRLGDVRESGNGITMEALVPVLAQSLDRTVVDRTGLTGAFDFTLEFAPETGPGAQPDAAPGSSASAPPPSIFTAVQEQLGLKLESQTGPVDVLVIDHIEQPSPN